MSQSPTKRDIIIEHLADALLQNGLGHTGLRGLGALAGTSDRITVAMLCAADRAWLELNVLDGNAAVVCIPSGGATGVIDHASELNFDVHMTA